jgi:hypothetical protein
LLPPRPTRTYALSVLTDQAMKADAFLQGIQVGFAYFMSVFRDWEFELRQVEKKVVDSVAFMDDFSLFLHIDSTPTRFGTLQGVST